MRRTVVSALLALSLLPLACATSKASTGGGGAPASDATPPAPHNPPILPLPRQVSPIPRLSLLTVSLAPRPGSKTCDLLMVQGHESDLPSLTKQARELVTADPKTQTRVAIAQSCTVADTKAIVQALNAGGITQIDYAVEAPPSSPNAPSADVSAAAKGTTAFALDLFKQLGAKEQGNLFYSPLSVSGALALVDVGAAGQTAKELDAALHTGLGHDRAHAALAQLLQRYAAAKGDATLDVANRLWGARDLAWKPGYLATVNGEFGAALQTVDFGKPDQARKTINDWVKQQTHDKIPELLQQDSIRGDTRLVLTNAVYFLGTWQKPFDPANTRDEPFTLASGKQVKTPMMHASEKLRGAEVDGVQIVELPYGKDGALAFDLVVPKDANGLGAVEGRLNPETLDTWLAALKRAHVTLGMPRFTERSQLELRAPLEALGLKSLFANADLSPMLEKGGVGISAVVHQAFVDVDEKGTEAAAATAVIGTRSLERMPTMVVTADHPFLFFIRDTQTGGILFMGRVADPKS